MKKLVPDSFIDDDCDDCDCACDIEDDGDDISPLTCLTTIDPHTLDAIKKFVANT